MARKKGIGSIIQLEKDKPKSKCRKWKLVVSLGRDPVTGKYPQKSKVFHGTYSEAVKALQEFVLAVQAGDAVRRQSWKFAAYAEHFCDVRDLANEVAPSTTYAHRCHLRALGHRIGAMRLQEVTPEVIERVYIELRAGESISGKKLRGTTLRDYHKSLRKMMAHAKDAGVIAKNPCDDVAMPGLDTEERRPLTERESLALFNRLDPANSMHCAILLCLTLGLRCGESVGLSWGDVDWYGSSVHITHALDRFSNLKTPKTKAGRRILPMSLTIKKLLAIRYAALIKVWGDDPDYTYRNARGKLVIRDDAPVVTNAYGKRASNSVLGYWWNRHRKSLGFPTLKLHELRHTFLTHLALKGVHPKVMQELAGHESPDITLAIYTHVNMTQKRAAMLATEGIYNDKKLKPAQPQLVAPTTDPAPNEPEPTTDEAPDIAPIEPLTVEVSEVAATGPSTFATPNVAKTKSTPGTTSAAA